MKANSDTIVGQKPPAKEKIAIQDASSWVLRIGVIASVAIMVLGMTLAFVEGNINVAFMEKTYFKGDIHAFIQGWLHLKPFPIMETGILLLVLTPIMRVFTAMVLFAVEERDWLYTAVTFLVLTMTLSALIFIK
ncbi:MAG: DUF1634 domain-containing protein [Candidatus Eremiobacteraeota bacterium]|jgi:uncharacterized membrane protein|nr:DUF1634 domain-containing protein [Candidatus Eremiobacteraeota bacterium]MCL5055201.1 DUF1634 domain-containing protein [Bacillota bacterium]